jgi:FlaA1/EpsC-like NDP-sugar epimerase
MRFYTKLVKHRALLATLHDVLVACFAWFMAFQLRFNFDIPTNFIQSLWITMAIAVPIQMLLFVRFGLYRGIWRFASIPDLKRIVLAALASAVLITALLLIVNIVIIPRSVLLLNPLLLILFMGGSRFAYRAWQEHRLYGVTNKKGTPVIVLGAGEAAIALVKELSRGDEWRVVGMLDDDNTLLGRELFGVTVLGAINQLKSHAHTLEVSHVIIAMPSAAHQARRNAVQLAQNENLTVLTVPVFDDLMSGRVSISQIRKVDVEDLLGRDTVKLDSTGLQRLIESHAVLVSGAGGSIGSELCRQIVKYNPSTLICLDISEFALYQLEQELSLQNVTIKLVFLTGDVKNSQRVKDLLAQYKPTVVFHAAAYKHVPLMENGNVWEALSNNVIGTHTLAQASKDSGVEKFVLISTDKAVNPTNVMGASKRLAEMVCQGLQDNTSKTSTKFVIVRFGNVLGSSGSVIPKFREQIASGGPVTITHPEITRYFMSIPEAAQLVMQAGLMGKGGEILVLDMGEPVRIAELAKDMIRLSGLQLDDIKIEYVGLRPGEKLYEELLASDEHTLPTPHEKLRIATARPVDALWLKKLLKWIASAQSANENLIKKELKFWVEEYSPQHQATLETSPDLTVEQITLH